ncbi:MAG: helix-turn-helix transcriptional regulator [Alphaproteobacteria bacterium]|nr:helix-turn-helix transcriptional regulator [Alphaproteobacteria bacterium]
MRNRLQIIGDKIREIRKSQNLSQIELAITIGIDRAYLSEIENGHTNTTINVLYAIADALEVDIKEFFTE